MPQDLNLISYDLQNVKNTIPDIFYFQLKFTVGG